MAASSCATLVQATAKGPARRGCTTSSWFWAAAGRATVIAAAKIIVSA